MEERWVKEAPRWWQFMPLKELMRLSPLRPTEETNIHRERVFSFNRNVWRNVIRHLQAGNIWPFCSSQIKVKVLLTSKQQRWQISEYESVKFNMCPWSWHIREHWKTCTIVVIAIHPGIFINIKKKKRIGLLLFSVYGRYYVHVMWSLSSSQVSSACNGLICINWGILHLKTLRSVIFHLYYLTLIFLLNQVWHSVFFPLGILIKS